MKSNQNLTIAQVVKCLNSRGYLVWRQENNGRIDFGQAIERLTDLLHGLSHVKYDKPKVSKLIGDILNKCYRPVPSSLKGVSDVIGFSLTTGRWISVEIKVGTDRLRPDQQVFLDSVRRSGGEAWVCYDFGSWAKEFNRSRSASA